MHPAELANSLDLDIVQSLGEGLFGASYLLDNGMVLKVTKDINEPPCVARIANYQAWELTPHLPYIEQYGWTEGEFYYIREYTENVELDIPSQASPEFHEWVELIKDPITDIESILSCAMRDDALDPANWGIRELEDGTSEMVWRDLACKC